MALGAGDAKGGKVSAGRAAGWVGFGEGGSGAAVGD